MIAVQTRYSSSLMQSECVVGVMNISIRRPEIVDVGMIRVVPLEDATFAKSTGVPERGCIATIDFDVPEDQPPHVEMINLQNWYNYRKQHWFAIDEQRLVCPDLIAFAGYS